MLKVATVLPHEPYREYKDVERVYSGSTEIDKILDKNGNVLFAVNKEVEGTPSLTYKGKEETNLKNYRIYGQTVDGESVGDRTGNLFDMKKFAETCFEYGATVNYTNNTLTFTATGIDAYVNAALSTGKVVPLQYRSSCIDVLPSTTYTISMSSAPRCFISWVDSSFNVVSIFTAIPTNATSYTFTTPENCTKLLIRLGKHVTNIGDTFTISDIMLNSGSTALPYEPYGYRVPVTVEGKNLFDETYPSIVSNTVKYKSIYVGDGQFTLSTTAPVYSGTATLFLLAGIATEGSDSATNGVHSKREHSVTSIDGYVTIGYRIRGNVDPRNYNTMLNAGSTALPYEPYHAPVTTHIYLPEQIKKVGDEAEYISYADQKLHRVGADDIDVTLPALPTLSGTNTLAVGTEVQPSNVYLKGRIKEVS